MNTRFCIYFAVCLGLGSASCGRNSDSNRVAPAVISDSFTLNTDASFASEKHRIGIATASLEKEFLLQSSLMNQQPLAMSSGLKSRIVMFKEFNNELLMLEASDGHLISDDFPSRLLLAKFPITEKSGDYIFFDFNAGMSKIFVNGDWYSAAAEQPGYDPSFNAVTVSLSFLEDVTFVGNRMSIRQIAQLANDGSTSTVEVKYYLEPYGNRDGFQPSSPADGRKMGFFTTAPRYDAMTGKTQAFATKFDSRKEIVFGISANTPGAYQEAVRDGILYWNRAFSNNPIKAVLAPEGVTAPSYDYNMIQWVRWDDAGFAYADAQSDPRTGEIRHAQVFMTSVFAISGRERAKRLLEKLNQPESSQKTMVSLQGFHQQPLCDRMQSQQLKHMLDALIRSDLDDEAILEVSKDYVREVIAHEVGHTLGLRHNFAGSLYQNYDPFERQQVFQQYLREAQAPLGAVPSSSVMEYQPFEEASISGDLIEKGFAALDYDRKAIQALYEGKSFSLQELPPFCSDGRGFADCQTFDLGRNPLESALWYLDQNTNLLVESLVQQFVSAKENKTEPYLNSDYWAGRFFANVSSVMSLFDADFRLLQVRRDYDLIDEYNLDEVKAREEAVLLETLQRFGKSSLIDVIAHSDSIDLDDIMNRFITAIEQRSELDDLEKGRARSLVRRLLNVLPEKILLAEIAMLAKPSQLAANTWSDQFLDYLEGRIRALVLATDGKVEATVFTEDELVRQVNLPSFVYSIDVRLAALETLAKDRQYKGWRVEAMKERLQQELKELEKQGFGDNNPKDFKDLDETASIWYSEYRAMIARLR